MVRFIIDRLGLSARLLAGVTAGFLALFIALGFLALQALDQSTRIILEERQSNARLAAHELDQFVSQAFYELDKATTFAPFDPTAGDLSAERHMLAHAYGRLGSFSLGVSFLDTRGRVVLTEPDRPEMIGTDLSEATHIREVLRTGQRTISVPHLDLREGKPVVVLTVPVRDRSGRIISLLCGVVDLAESPVTRVLTSAAASGGSMHADVFTANGTVVASTEQGHLLGPGEHLEYYTRVFAAGAPTIETVPEIKNGAPVDEHVMAFVPLANAPWGLTLGASAADTFAPINDFRRTLVFAGLLFFSAVLSLTLAGAQILVHPVLSLTRAAHRMAEGDLSQRIWVSEGAEIGLLAASLETMRQRLDASLREVNDLNASLEEHIEERTKELATRNRELAASASISAKVSASLDIEEVLRNGLEGLLDVVEADVGAVWLSDPVDGTLRLRAHHNLPAEFLTAENEIPCGECLCGIVAATGNPLIVRDLANHPLTVRQTCGHTGLNSLALVPLASRGEVRGVLLVGARTGVFGENDTRLIAAVGHQISVAVENARLYDELQKNDIHLRHLLGRIISVQEEERKRIARELHDETGQALTALIMTLDSTAESLPRSQEQLRGRLKRAEEMSRKSLDEIRKIILDLRPSALDDLGLVSALRRYAESRLRPLGVTSDVQAIDCEERFWPETEVVLFRIGQEAVNNVARHAEATEVHIEVRQSGDRVELQVTDDGKGFDWSHVEHSSDPMRGLGLAGMQERAALFGGSCVILSEPGKGTRVRVSVPQPERVPVPNG